MPVVQWLKGWNAGCRLKLTVSASDIDDTLTHFPVMIHLSKSCGKNKFDARKLFTCLGANKQKIAVTKNDGVTQLYVEIEQWDESAQEAVLWVSRSDWNISSTTDTTLYLYYDVDHIDNTNYVDVVGSAVGQSVWDTNFKLVCHMNDNPDTSHVKDSTSNGYDGTKKAANEPIEATGKTGEAQNFDGTDDYINLGNDSDIEELKNKNLSAFVTMKASGNQTVGIGYGTGLIGSYGTVIAAIPVPNQFWQLTMYWNVHVAGVFYRRDNNAEEKLLVGTTPLNDAVYHRVGFIKRGLDLELWVDGTREDLDTLAADGATDNNQTPKIGTYRTNNFYGIIDQVTVSNSPHSTAWITADHKNQFDLLLTFEIEYCEVTQGTGVRVQTPPLPRTLLVNVRNFLASKVSANIPSFQPLPTAPKDESVKLVLRKKEHCGELNE